MSQLKPLPIFKRGQMLKAADLMEICRRIMRQRLTAGQNSGILLSESEKGTTIAVTTQAQFGSVASPTGGAITARVGTTPGSGNASLFSYDPVMNKLVDAGVVQAVKNFSSAAGGIALGKYCWIEPDANGTWWVVSAEC